MKLKYTLIIQLMKVESNYRIRPIKIGKVIASGAYNEILETDLNRIIQIPHELIKKHQDMKVIYIKIWNFT